MKTEKEKEKDLVQFKIAQALLKEKAKNGEIEIIENNGVVYEVRNWGSRFRTDVYGNNAVRCKCPDLKRVIGIFCVCYGIAYCPTHGWHGCVGGHD